MQMFNAEQLQEKWAPILNHEGSEAISDTHKRMVTAVLLENQEKFLSEERAFLNEGVPTNSANAAGASGGFGGSAAGVSNGGTPNAGFDPVLISQSVVLCLTWSLMT